MERYGFIHEKLDIKILILFVLNELPAPVDELKLSELVFCDDGIGYFDYSDCLAELTESGQIMEQDHKYQITSLGRENVEVVGSSIPYSVRTKALKLTAPLAAQMRRAAMITAEHQTDDDGLCTVHLSVSDGISPILEMRILAANEQAAEAMEKTFQDDAENLYHKIVGILTESEESK